MGWHTPLGKEALWKQTPHTATLNSDLSQPLAVRNGGFKIIPRIKLPPMVSPQVQRHFSKNIQSAPGCTPPDETPSFFSIWIMSSLLVVCSYFTSFQWVICQISSWEQLVTEIAWYSFVPSFVPPALADQTVKTLLFPMFL